MEKIYHVTDEIRRKVADHVASAENAAIAEFVKAGFNEIRVQTYTTMDESTFPPTTHLNVAISGHRHDE